MFKVASMAIPLFSSVQELRFSIVLNILDSLACKTVTTMKLLPSAAIHATDIERRGGVEMLDYGIR